MEASTAPAQLDFRAELHQLIDQIQDEAVLRAALLLLAPFGEVRKQSLESNPSDYLLIG